MAETEIETGDSQGLKVGKKQNIFEANDDSIRPAYLARRIPGTEEPGGLRSMGSHRVGHDWSDLAAAAAFPSKMKIPWKAPISRGI